MSPADAPRLDDQLCFALYAASRATVNAYRDHLAPLVRALSPAGHKIGTPRTP